MGLAAVLRPLSDSSEPRAAREYRGIYWANYAQGRASRSPTNSYAVLSSECKTPTHRTCHGRRPTSMMPRQQLFLGKLSPACCH